MLLPAIDSEFFISDFPTTRDNDSIEGPTRPHTTVEWYLDLEKADDLAVEMCIPNPKPRNGAGQCEPQGDNHRLAAEHSRANRRPQARQESRRRTICKD